MTNKWINDLGLAKRAGKVVTGGRVLESIRNNKAKLVIVASDASDNTKKRIFDKSKFYNVPCYELCDSFTLSKSLGMISRMYAAVNDDNFAQLIIKKIKEEYHVEKEKDN